MFLTDDGEVLVKHDEEDFVANLRAFIDTVSLFLKCSMDVQTGNGKLMVLRYVASYVAKWKDSFACKGLCNTL